ncbi:MAG TPA: tetratricopeptide repeat protein [Blastocatellia bacterium]|jgi:tetratricopeptide (TPR) repeat protein|nr:tetratricopeptide repeat protein [Blastocatellia bacterium]
MRIVFKRVQAALLLISLIALPSVAADWSRGVALYNKNDYREALAEFQDLVRDRPDIAGAWYYIGLCEFKLKRYKRVERPLARAVDLLEIQSPSSPDIAGAWYTIGFSHYLSSEYEKAVEPLKRYMEITSKAKRALDPGARAALGRSYFFLERYDEAMPLLAANGPATEQSKESASNAYYIGAIHFKREDDERAVAALREAVKAGPEETAALELLAESLMRKARKASPNGAPNAAATAAWAEAAEAAERLAALRDDQKTAGILGRAYLGANRFDKAVAPLEKIAKANTGNAQAWLFYGIALSRSGQMRKAMEALEITIQLAPDSVPALSELAFVYESDKQYQQALRIYERAYAATNNPAIKESMERVRALAAQQP